MMKKFYSLLVLMAISFSSLSADPGFLTWSVVGFDATEWASGEKVLVAMDTKGKEYKVKVTVKKFEFSERTQYCTILDKEYSSISYISLFDDASMEAGNANKIAYAPYVLFEPLDGNFYIKKIEIIGHSRNSDQSFTLLGFSETNATPTGNNVTCPYNLENLEVLEPYCQDPTFMPALPAPAICTVQGDWIGGDEQADNFQQGVKYIRLNWSGAEFGGRKTPDRGGSLELFGFQIYTNVSGIATSLEDESADSLAITRNGDLLGFNSRVDVKVYSLSGAIQLNASAVEEVSLESLQQGVYIVQAKDVQTGKVQTEKVVK